MNLPEYRRIAATTFAASPLLQSVEVTAGGTVYRLTPTTLPAGYIAVTATPIRPADPADLAAHGLLRKRYATGPGNPVPYQSS